MMTKRQICSYKNIVKWGIRKMFENYAGITLTLNELRKATVEAWDEMVEDGEIILENGEDF